MRSRSQSRPSSPPWRWPPRPRRRTSPPGDVPRGDADRRRRHPGQWSLRAERAAPPRRRDPKRAYRRGDRPRD